MNQQEDRQRLCKQVEATLTNLYSISRQYQSPETKQAYEVAKSKATEDRFMVLEYPNLRKVGVYDQMPIRN